MRREFTRNTPELQGIWAFRDEFAPDSLPPAGESQKLDIEQISSAVRSLQHLVRVLSNFTVTPAAESGDKLTRFGPFSSQCRAGNVKIRRGAWNEELFRVLEGFPELAHDDEVDACSGALEILNHQLKNAGIMNGCA